MTTEAAIANVNTVGIDLREMARTAADACESAKAQWDGLRAAGGARADHAATILAKIVKPDLLEVIRFCQQCVNQIDLMNEKPFAYGLANMF